MLFKNVDLFNFCIGNVFLIFFFVAVYFEEMSGCVGGEDEVRSSCKVDQVSADSKIVAKVKSINLFEFI